ncbi:transmembrane protein [Marinobacter santoriniensis NKSG1]|uniref:Transmembrane protein n=1 Tax=Marinobacter santoriniensis NKSG1 TaxID=1288826 RepID=M7DAN1_9GAMM|nr:DoxX family protein [Marinobacter santoriniensis]EMP54727.1 transmembrane protein [Marinobacter santoriniensis NKSG1]
MMAWMVAIDRWGQRLTTYAIPLLLLATRLWVADVFFRAGLVKIDSWSSTLYLFEYEYQVPVLPPVTAAYVGTVVELVAPVILALGLMSRPTALFMFVYNAMAVISYPTLWEGGFYDHQLWGLMLLINLIWGGGALSLDRLVAYRWQTIRSRPG